MAIRVALNGFGRIGRNILRSIIENERKDIEIVAINSLGDIATYAHLLRYDSVHGPFRAAISFDQDMLSINPQQGYKPIKMTSYKTPEDWSWHGLDIDIVMECTGRFTERAQAARHLAAGAKRVLVSAPCKGADITVVYGVNHDKITAQDEVISNASCTTNCLAPIAKILNEGIGIEHGFMTTIHSYTGDQRNLDSMHKDPYRARAFALSIIPTSTGAARAVGLVLPELSGKLDGVAVRVPTPNVSAIDFVFTASRPTSVAEINSLIKSQADGPMRNVLAYNEEPLVSIDFNHNPHSSIFHMDQTKVMSGSFCRILSWYDNEWGFSNRMCDSAVAIAKTMGKNSA